MILTIINKQTNNTITLKTQSVTDPDKLKQSKFTDHGINFLKIFAAKKVHRQKMLKEYVAADLLQKKSIFYSTNEYISKLE